MWYLFLAGYKVITDLNMIEMHNAIPPVIQTMI